MSDSVPSIDDLDKMQVSKVYKYLTVVVSPRPEGRRTNVYYVINKKRSCIGVVKWHGPWKRFCFYPSPESCYDPVCLESVADFCRLAMSDYREERHGPRADGKPRTSAKY